MNVCGMLSVKSSGQYYTWNNKQEGRDRVFCKLDRVLRNDKWKSEWVNTEVTILPEGEFDHYPLNAIKYNKMIAIQQEMHNKPESLELREQEQVPRQEYMVAHMWCKADKFLDIFTQCWQQTIQGTKMYQIVKKLKCLKKDLKELNASQFGDMSEQNAIKYNMMIVIQQERHNKPESLELREQEQVARQEYMVAHTNYVQFLGQKAKARWLNEGDDNTRLFHQCVKARRIQNRINTIRREDGTWANNSNEVACAFLDFYHGLLGSEGQVRKVEGEIIAKGKVFNATQKQALDLNFSA
ncbi:uncharacterized protein LOC104894085 [Beta vulgaris subsp. vulgaris]|uniref:uncharacterized protein LOC104894085 n=1 Tax=Beta vulgaris subsp. vulgaris TaxID=3555 RepID=UPI0005402D33|nr:uncharacterized protein LOC104894085 [Beta vulgaris subsp. vulgaris]